MYIATDIECAMCGHPIAHHSEEGFSCGPECGMAILHESLMMVFKEALEGI
jgi:hypothetical protein